MGDWKPGRYALYLRNVVRLKDPIPYGRGSQGRPIPVRRDMMPDAGKALEIALEELREMMTP